MERSVCRLDCQEPQAGWETGQIQMVSTSSIHTYHGTNRVIRVFQVPLPTSLPNGFFSLIHFVEHADYLSLSKYAGENNILLSQAVALVFAGTLFPELKMPHNGKNGMRHHQ